MRTSEREARDGHFPLEKYIIPLVPDTGQNRTDIFGLPLDVTNLAGAVDACRAAWRKPSRLRIITLNPLMVEAALKDENIAGLIRRADMVVADGVGIVWAARKLRGVDVPLIPGIELASALLDECAASRHPVFLLGGEKGVAAEAAENLAATKTNLRIVGTHHGYFPPEEDSRIVELVNASGAHLVLCGMGFPRQDEILEKIIAAGKPPPCYDPASGIICEPSETGASVGARKGSDAGVTGDNSPIPPMICIGVGGSLDVFAGRIKRTSPIWRKLRLEWLVRILSQPRKRLKGLATLARFWWRVTSA